MKPHFCIYLSILILVLYGCTREDDSFSNRQQVVDGVDSLQGGDMDSIVGGNILLNCGLEKWEMDFCEYPQDWLLPHGYCNKVTRNQNIVLEGQ